MLDNMKMRVQNMKKWMKMMKEKKEKFLAKLPKREKPWISEKTLRILNKYSLLFHVLLAAVVCFSIESISRHSVLSAFEFVTSSPLTFLYNTLIIFASLMLVYLVKFRALLRIIISVFWLILGIINGCVLASRVTPFNFTDLKMVGDLLTMKNTSYFTTTQQTIVLVSLIALGIFLVVFAIKGPRFKGKMRRLRYVAGLIICLAAIPAATKLGISSNILSGYFGNLAQGYKEYGFVYSFSASVVDRGMSRPADYSEEKIKQIESEVTAKETTLDTENAPNIIVVLLESFVDPTEINFLEMSEDPIPTFHSLEENYTTGHLTVPVVGAGTANTEFEVLTGMGIQYFGLGEYPYKTILKETDCESIAADLKELGYSAHAVHNNGGNFYGRANIFAQMGFDSFTSKELMNITEYNEIHSWPKDDVMIDEVSECLDSTPDQADLVYTITVQAHGSYPNYQVFEDPAIEVSGAETEEENYQWEYYVNQLHQVDKFIGNLINEVNQRDEDTMIVLFGDHLPTMGLEESDIETGDLFQTQYITWNNFGMEKKDADLTSYQLLAYMTDQIGIHNGTIFTYHQNALDKGITDTTAYIDDLENLQYDILYGNRYCYNGIDKYPRSELVMGVQDVEITHAVADEDAWVLRIYGNNFTPWSKIYVNDEKIKTTYLSGTCVEISLDNIENGDTFVVNQVGSSDTVFRSSNEMIAEIPEDFEKPTDEESKEEIKQIEDTDPDEIPEEETDGDTTQEDATDNAAPANEQGTLNIRQIK